MDYELTDYSGQFRYYGVEDSDLYTIYKFIGEHSDQSNEYCLKDNSFLVGNKELMHRFGIYEYGYNSDKTVTPKDNTYRLLILEYDDFDSYDGLLSKVSKLVTDKEFTHCIIEHDYKDNHTNVTRDHAYKLHRVLPNLVILNSDFGIYYKKMGHVRRDEIDVAYYRRVLPKARFINLAPVIYKYNCNSISTDESLSEVMKMLEELVILGESAKDAIFYYDGSTLEYTKATSKSYDFYLQAAAYLTYSCGYHFIITNSDLDLYSNYRDRLVSREFMYASDYLHMIFNPPELGFLDTQLPCICVRNNSLMFPNSKKNTRDLVRYGVDMSVCFTEFDLDTKQMIDDSAKYTRISYSRIELLDIGTIFDLRNPDYNIAVRNLDQLNKLIRKFEGFLVKSSAGNIVSNDLVNLTNTIIFKNQSKCYIGYVNHLTGKIPYMLIPIAGNHKPFYTEFTIDDGDESLMKLTKMMDINVLFDREAFISKFVGEGYISGNNLHFRLPNYAKTSLISSVAFTAGKVKEIPGITVEDLGIWSQTSFQLRGYIGYLKNKLTVLERCDVGTLRNMSFLTFFGGPHPALKTNFSETPDMWR